MNRSHRHGAGSGCLGTMEVKSKVRGALTGGAAVLLGAGPGEGQGLAGGGLRSGPGAGVGERRGGGTWGREVVVINSPGRGRRWGGGSCLLLARAGR